MGNANNKQVGGSHYKSTHECWDYITANNLGYLEGTAIKYLTRWRKKNGIEDLKKAIHFIEKLIEVEEGKASAQKTMDDVSRLPLVDLFDSVYHHHVPGLTNAVEGLRGTYDLAGETGYSIPVPTGELNNITILRKDYVYD